MNSQTRKIVGFVNFNCFCGLDIYCFGADEDGSAPVKAMKQFGDLLGNRPAGIFSAADGSSANCPACNIELELPSAEMVAWFADRESKREVAAVQADSPILPGISTSSSSISLSIK